MVEGKGGEWLLCHIRPLERSIVQKDTVEGKTYILNIT